MGIIYCARNQVNGKLYIGKTIRALEVRRRGHEKGRHKRGTAFAQALLKYGTEAFTWTVLDSAESEEELDQLEQIYIDLFSSSIKECGYNLTHGGDGGRHNDESRAKLSKALKGRPGPRLGIPTTDEMKRKISATLKRRYAAGEIQAPNKGKPMDPKVYQAMREGWRKLTKEQRGVRDWTPEERKRHGECLKGRKCPRVKLVHRQCVVCGEEYANTAGRSKFCPQCLRKYTEDERNQLRKDGYVHVPNPPREFKKIGKTPRGVTLYLLTCTTCTKSFVCGTITRKQCPECRGQAPTESCYMYESGSPEPATV